MSLVIGIDPGLTGAVATMTPEGRLLTVEDMPVLPIPGSGKTSRTRNEISAALLVELLRRQWSGLFDLPAPQVVVERVHPMPAKAGGNSAGTAGHGTQAAFSLGDSLGVIRGVVAALGFPIERVGPRTWRAHYGLGTGKEFSRATALALYPGAPLKRKKDHGRAEAILIARWWVDLQRRTKA